MVKRLNILRRNIQCFDFLVNVFLFIREVFITVANTLKIGFLLKVSKGLFNRLA